MNIFEYAKFFLEENNQLLKENYPGISEKRICEDLEIFCSELGMSELGLLNHDDYLIQLGPFYSKLLSGVPLAYIVGRSYFYNSYFNVSEDVLIPRFETEILVEKTLEEIKRYHKQGMNDLKVSDIGTGSGAIILTVMQDSSLALDATAVDISEAALNVAKLNYKELSTTFKKNHNINFILGDRLININERQDIIVSNPPYIKERDDFDNVHENVNKHEPHLALYLKDSEYEQWFTELFSQVASKLNDGGVFIMEGHEHHLVWLSGLASSCGLSDVKVLKDFTGRDRFLKAYLK